MIVLKTNQKHPFTPVFELLIPEIIWCYPTCCWDEREDQIFLALTLA